MANIHDCSVHQLTMRGFQDLALWGDYISELTARSRKNYRNHGRSRYFYWCADSVLSAPIPPRSISNLATVDAGDPRSWISFNIWQKEIYIKTLFLQYMSPSRIPYILHITLHCERDPESWYSQSINCMFVYIINLNTPLPNQSTLTRSL